RVCFGYSCTVGRRCMAWSVSRTKRPTVTRMTATTAPARSSALPGGQPGCQQQEEVGEQRRACYGQRQSGYLGTSRTSALCSTIPRARRKPRFSGQKRTALGLRASKDSSNKLQSQTQTQHSTHEPAVSHTPCRAAAMLTAWLSV